MDLKQANTNIAKIDAIPFLEHIANNYSSFDIPFVLGRDAYNNDLFYGLEKCPHLLVSGTTGSGKSVFLNNLILSAVFSKKCSLVLIDVKRVEFAPYKDNKCLIYPVATDIKAACLTLNALLEKVEARYKLLESVGARNIKEYNKKTGKTLDYIVCVIDELADIVLQSKQFEKTLIRIAQISRACGVHLVCATQRPSSEIISGLIRANFPSRICFRVQSASNSRIILDRNGGELLRGYGDGLFLASGFNELIRFQAPIISDPDFETLIYSLRR